MKVSSQKSFMVSKAFRKKLLLTPTIHNRVNYEFKKKHSCIKLSQLHENHETFLPQNFHGTWYDWCSESKTMVECTTRWCTSLHRSLPKLLAYKRSCNICLTHYTRFSCYLLLFLDETLFVACFVAHRGYLVPCYAPQNLYLCITLLTYVHWPTWFIH